MVKPAVPAESVVAASHSSRSSRQERIERRARLHEEATTQEAPIHPPRAPSRSRSTTHASSENAAAPMRRSSRLQVGAAIRCSNAPDPPTSVPPVSSTRGQKRHDQAPPVGTALAKKLKPSVTHEEGRVSNPNAAVAATSGRSYNLRSTAARAERAVDATGTAAVATATATAALITPRSPARARHIDFTEHSPSQTDILPPGVMNIFSHPSRCSPRCKCPVDRCVQTDTALGFSHLANYGEEHGEILKEREMQQVNAILRRVPTHSSPVSSVQTNDDMSDVSVLEMESPHAMIRGSYSVRGAIDFDELNLRGVGQAISADTRNRIFLRQPYLSTRMRAILVHWLVEVGDEYKISDPAFHLSVSLIDRLLLQGPTTEELNEFDEDEDGPEPWFLIARTDFQAVGCACAWIASKLEDRNAPSVDDYVWISDRAFHSNKLRNLEQKVCKEFKFCLNQVTPYHFVNLFLRASNACPAAGCEFDHPVLRQVVLYLLTLSRLSYQLSLYPPSLLAAAAVYLGRATVGLREENPTHAVHPQGFWTRTLEYYTGYNVNQLRQAVLTIHRFQLGAEIANDIKGIYNKFSRPNHLGASLKTALRVEDLGFDTSSTHDAMDFSRIAMQPS